MEVHINYLAVVVAAVAYFILGWLWYSPLMFGKVWMELMGIKMPSEAERKKMMAKMWKSMIVAFVASLLTAMCMAHMVQSGSAFYKVTGLEAGLRAGFWIWLGFIVTSQINSVLWERRPFKLYLINIGHYLVGYLILGSILALWP